MSRFELKATTQAEEDGYNIVANRNLQKPSGMLATVANVVKGALGAGILSSHVAYMKAGYGIALIGTLALGCYLTFCLWLWLLIFMLLLSGHWYCIDAIICTDLYGSCACYQLIIAKSIKQLVDDVPNGPRWNLRIYLAILIIPCICICLLRHLQVLAKLSLVANLIIVMCICLTIYYATVYNPKFENMVFVKDPSGFFIFCGMSVFSMSCAGIIVSIENNMRNPDKFTPSFFIAMSCITSAVALTAFFGYAAFLEKSESPITVNFPMQIFPKIIKATIAVMIYVTHGLNFWAPFNLTFHYLKKCHKPEKHIMMEYIYRAIIVLCISMIAIAFPSINALMGFLGVVCHTLMCFIWPQVISLLVWWERPGFGKLRWRLWRGILFIIIGCVLFVAGSIVAVPDLFKVLTGKV